MLTGELFVAAEDGDVQGVKDNLSRILGSELMQTNENAKAAKLIDDVDCNGKTSMMAAARGDGSGGDDYAKIMKMLWKGHKKCGTGRDCLLAKDDKHKWIVLMHSAKCGDPKNLQMVLDMYIETFGTLSCVQDEIDWANVDHKVKSIISNKVFDGNANPISNFGNNTRRSRRVRQTRTSANQGQTAKSNDNDGGKESATTSENDSNKQSSQQSAHESSKKTSADNDPEQPPLKKMRT